MPFLTQPLPVPYFYTIELDLMEICLVLSFVTCQWCLLEGGRQSLGSILKVTKPKNNDNVLSENVALRLYFTIKG